MPARAKTRSLGNVITGSFQQAESQFADGNKQGALEHGELKFEKFLATLSGLVFIHADVHLPSPSIPRCPRLPGRTLFR